MEPEVVTTADLLERWREATRAAELAERLAQVAMDSAQRADRSAEASEDIARLAERAARSAERAARSARQAATRATAFAQESRAGRLAEADRALTDARAKEKEARGRYHAAEEEARRRQGL